jgi:hypothetical protein
VLDAAAKDKNISTVVLLLDELDSAGLATLHEVGLAALDRVKAAGKPVIAWGGSLRPEALPAGLACRAKCICTRWAT